MTYEELESKLWKAEHDLANERKLGRDEVIDLANMPIDKLEVLWQKAVDDNNFKEASFILYIIDSRKDYTKIHEICQKDKLGFGGESVVDTLINGYNSLKEEQK